MSRRFVKIDENVLSVIEYVYNIREQERAEEAHRLEAGEGALKQKEDYLHMYNIFDKMGRPAYKSLTNARSGKIKWLSVDNFDRILCAINRPELIHYFKEYTVVAGNVKEHTDIETWDIPEGGII